MISLSSLQEVSRTLKRAFPLKSFGREIISTLQVGDTLLIDDGKLRMTVSGTGDDFVETTVDVGGAISNRKGDAQGHKRMLPLSPSQLESVS